GVEFFRRDDAGDGLGGGELHLLVDARGAALQRAAEDAGEAEHVVYLVRVVAPARRHHGDVARGLFGHDLRRRVRHREDDGVFRHPLYVFDAYDARNREAEENVRAAYHVVNRAALAFGVGEARVVILDPVHVLRAPAVDGPVLVAAHDVSHARAQNY